jgi:quinol---cytochrome c reductase cytochrome b subunit, bacillus type
MSLLPRLGRKPPPPADNAEEIPGVLRRGPGLGGDSGGNDRGGRREALKKGAAETGVGVTGWLEERFGMAPLLKHTLFRKVPGHDWTYTLGVAVLFAFLSQAVTGVFLAMFYDPSPTQAYSSAAYITNEVFLGEFVRGMHRWGSTVMIVLIFLHMGQVFFYGAYKYPREMNWLIGVVLLVLTLMMGLTGYLLPFDQRSFWATIVAVNLNGAAPIVGPYLSDFLRGGPDFNAVTISRFYAIHMLLVPGLIAVLIGAHLYLVTKLGTTAPPWVKAKKRTELAKEEI